MNKGATSGAGSWVRNALDGDDDKDNASLKRKYEDVAGKIGYLLAGQTLRGLTTHHDGRCVDCFDKDPAKSYVLDLHPILRTRHTP